MEYIASNQMNCNLSSDIDEDYTADQIKNIFETMDTEKMQVLNKKYSKSDLIDYVFSYGIFSNEQFVFKNSNKFNFYKNFFDYIALNKSDITAMHSSIFESILTLLGTINRGQYILYKLPYKEMFNKLSTQVQKDLYFSIGVNGTLPTFLLVDKLIENKNYVSVYNKSILSAACRNGDDRILKYIINNFQSYDFPVDNEQFVTCVINNIFSPHIPHKYVYRRLKLVNSKIELKPYFSQMLRVVRDHNMFEKIYKYYNDSKSIIIDHKINMSSFIGFIENSDHESLKGPIQKIVDVLENKYDKYMFLIEAYIDFYEVGTEYFDISKYYHEEFEKNESILKYHQRFINNILCMQENKTNQIFNKEFVRNFKCILTNFSISFSHFTNTNKSILLFFLPFVPYFSRKLSIHIKLNLIKFHLKVFLRKRNMFVKIMKRIDQYNFKETIISPFTKIPPRHCVPFELDTIQGTDEGFYTISEKADGCLVDFIPNTVEPSIDAYTSGQIKAEFVEDLDLYLIFDSNIEINVLDRYDNLRSVHPHTKDSKPIREMVINNYQELKNAISEERKLFEEFLKQPFKNYRVYPKARWLVTDPSKLNKELVENIIQENDCDHICKNGSYENDGLIITPLNGAREIKLKPKSMHTIDLLYSNGWKDREGNSWNHIISCINKPRNGVIMRCYPKFVKNGDNYMFEATEIRLDKTKPNTNKVVKMIYGLHSIDWSKLYLGANSYYQTNMDDNKIKSKSWHDVIIKQNNNLKLILSKSSIEPKSSWLDLGCGSGRMIKFLKDYMISSYVGMDYDMKQLIMGTHMSDKNSFMSRNCRFIHCNLQDEWNTSHTSIDFLSSDEKFDYIIANHSLAHFYDKNFWTKLNNVSESNSTFIFNVVNQNIETEWVSGKDYMKKDEQLIKYKFNSVHNEEMSELYIDENELESRLKENKWNIIEKFIPNGNDLDSKYTWYIVKRT